MYQSPDKCYDYFFYYLWDLNYIIYIYNLSNLPFTNGL